MKEKWRPISQFKDKYQVSSLGRVRSSSADKIKSGIVRKLAVRNGYLVVSANIDNKTIGASVHRLVALAFIPNPENKPQVNHKNGVKADNRVENLEWCTHLENNLHAFKNGLIKKGEDKPLSKLTEKDVLKIRKLYKTKSLRQIAKKFKVSFVSVHHAIIGKTWKHVK